MSRRSCRAATGLGVCGVALLLAVAPPGPSQEPKSGPAPEKDSASADKVRAAEQVVAGIEVEHLTDGRWVKVNRIEKPLLLYSDDTRDDDRGSVWGWADKGRPVALIELYQKASDGTLWRASICNTSGGRVRASRGGARWWQANDSAVELKDVPGAPPPAAGAAQRQRQLKQLAQRFTGHEFWAPGETRYDLRRLDRPLHTYRDEAAGILDGGVFALANGTNPEILLFVEARTDPKDMAKASWQFAVGRLADAPLHLEYDGKEVAALPRAETPPRPVNPYWTAALLMADETTPRKE